MTPPSGAPGRAPRGVRLTRRLPDDPQSVFRAFTDADALRQWWGPRDFRIETIDFPARVGATYRVTLAAPDGSHWAHEGTFVEVEPPRRLVYTWSWTEGPMSDAETLVELTFDAVPGGTLVTVVHSGFTRDVECDAHATGWTDTFERVSRWFSASRR